MSRLFDDAASEYLEDTSGAPVSAAPLSFSCWFYSDDIAVSQCLIQIQDKDAGDHYFSLRAMGGVGGDPIRWQVREGATIRNADTSGGFSADTWHHAFAVERSSTDREVYVDGANSGTNTDSAVPGTQDSISIGRMGDSTPTQYMSGRIAEVAIWSVDVSAHVGALAKGFSPEFFQPESLVSYSRLIRDEDLDRWGAVVWTAFNTPSIATHPPKIIYPAPPFISYPTAAAAANAPTGHLLGPLYGPLGGPIAV